MGICQLMDEHFEQMIYVVPWRKKFESQLQSKF